MDCQNINENVAEHVTGCICEPQRSGCPICLFKGCRCLESKQEMKHDDYCPSRMGRRCECDLITAARSAERTTVQSNLNNLHSNAQCPTCSDLRVQIVDGVQ